MSGGGGRIRLCFLGGEGVLGGLGGVAGGGDFLRPPLRGGGVGGGEGGSGDGDSGKAGGGRFFFGVPAVPGAAFLGEAMGVGGAGEGGGSSGGGGESGWGGGGRFLRPTAGVADAVASTAAARVSAAVEDCISSRDPPARMHATRA